MQIRFFLFIAVLFTSNGCASTAGPFVTSVTNDGKGGIAVEKCYVIYNKLTNDVKTGECTSHVIDVSNGK